MRLRVSALALATSGAALALQPVERPQLMGGGVHAVSPPLWLMRPAIVAPPTEDHEPRRIPLSAPAEPVHDPVVQRGFPALMAPPTKLVFDGIGLGTVRVPSGESFRVEVDPPDPQGDVGPDHYVQIVNSSIAVFSKAGTLLLGPLPTQTVFAGLGGACGTGRGFDGVVLYDPLADRWLISQLAWLDQGNGPYWECIAVSRTPDPTGQYAQYGYQYTNFNDYPKLAVWPDGYYVTYNMFANGSPASRMTARRFCAFDRIRMVAGEPAPFQQCTEITSSEVSGLTPADFDGQLPPPAGEPATALGFFRTDTLVVYRFHVDWEAPGNSSIDAVAIPAAPFEPLCTSVRTGYCVPQLGGQVLDGLGDRIMFRVAYRNMGAYQSLIANQNVTAGSAGAVRWYEIRNPAGDPYVYQQGTYAPDSRSRWMGSAAMDRAGDIGLGYSVSGSEQNVGIGISGRTVADALGVMGSGETVIPGGGAESSFNRWGDYTSMSVDPVDDCTFWYTAQYIPFDGARNWRTRVVTFELPGCATAPDFSVWMPVDRGSVRSGDKVEMIISTAALRHSAAATPIQLAVSAFPPGAGLIAEVQPPEVMPGQPAKLTITASPDVRIGEVPFAIQATVGTVTQTAAGSVAVIDSDFAVSTEKTSISVGERGNTDLQVKTSTLFGKPQVVLFSVSGVPRGVQASFDPISARAGEGTTLRLESTPFLAPGESKIKITATGTLISRTAVVRLRTLFQPLATIIDPRPYSHIAGNRRVAVTGGASLGTTLKSIEIYLDGEKIPGLVAATSPAELMWNTASADDGPHLLIARATDAEGNQGSSSPVAVWIQNKGECGCSATGGGWEAIGLLGLLAAIRRRRS
jgi:MYXO-CTERM domain-containing protein